MDELLYFIALVVGIIGNIFLWKYAREKRKKAYEKLNSEDGLRIRKPDITPMDTIRSN